MIVRVGDYLHDRYEILSKIGTGGMSEVYKADDCKLNRTVAIKVLKENVICHLLAELIIL